MALPVGGLHLALGIACWLLGVNSLAVLAFHHDKRMAELGGWRVPEQTLLAIAAVGGSAGALLARARFRHKTRKQPFGMLLEVIFVMQVLAAAGLGLFAARQWASPWLH